MIERCENSDSCPVSLSNCLKKCCFDRFNASLVIYMYAFAIEIAFDMFDASS